MSKYGKSVKSLTENAIAKLTPRQELFVEFYLQNGNAGKSAELAGYAGGLKTCQSIGSQNLALPKIQEALDLKKHDLRKRFVKEAGAAFTVIVGLMNNPKVSPRTRLDAAKDVLDRAGYNPTDKVELSGVDGSPIQYETRLTREISNRARTLMNDLNTPIDVQTESCETIVETIKVISE